MQFEQFNIEVKRNHLIKFCLLRVVKILTAVCFLTACSGPKYPAPLVDLQQPPSLKITSHTVAKGETLYSIAWRYNIDINDLARANSLKEPFTLYPGQDLNLDVSQTGSAKQLETKEPILVKSRSRSQPSAVKNDANKSPKNAQLRWQWPAHGTVLAKFSGPAALNKGVDISGKKGDPVHAAESGTVVYAGSGIRGYGKLLIVKHDQNYLSAYAHNDKLLAAEGDSVKAGQKVAEIGSTGTDRDKLHFEIRREGKPVDPLRYLPAR